MVGEFPFQGGLGAVETDVVVAVLDGVRVGDRRVPPLRGTDPAGAHRLCLVVQLVAREHLLEAAPVRRWGLFGDANAVSATRQGDELVGIAGVVVVLGADAKPRRPGAGVGPLQLERGDEHPLAVALDAGGVLVARAVEKQRFHLGRLP